MIIILLNEAEECGSEHVFLTFNVHNCLCVLFFPLHPTRFHSMNFYTFKVKMLNDFLFVYVIAVSSLAQRISWKPGKKGSIKLNKNRFEYLYEEKKNTFRR